MEGEREGEREGGREGGEGNFKRRTCTQDISMASFASEGEEINSTKKDKATVGLGMRLLLVWE